MNPYYLFPPELWEMINNHMKSPEDKLKLMRAHPNLYNQFGGKEKEEELLFLSALPIILGSLESSGRQIGYYGSKIRREVFFSCRLISSSSCKVVDKWMDSFWKKSEGSHLPPSFFQNAGPGRSFGVLSRPAIDKFLEDFKDSTGTELLGRFATFPVSFWDFGRGDVLYQGDIARIRRQILDESEKRIAVFKKIGPHLRKLEVEFAMEVMNNQELWLAELNSVRNVLELTPNLKSLIFTLPVAQACRLEYNQEFSLPPLPHLDHLKVVAIWKRAQEDILASLMVYFRQLKELDFKEVVDFQDDYLAEGLFPELKLLKMTAALFEFPETEVKVMQIFEKISAPKLARVELKFETKFYPIDDLEELKQTALFFLNRNPTFSRPEPELQWEVATVQGVGHSQNITLIFSRNINHGQNTKDRQV